MKGGGGKREEGTKKGKLDVRMLPLRDPKHNRMSN